MNALITVNNRLLLPQAVVQAAVQTGVEEAVEQKQYLTFMLVSEVFAIDIPVSYTHLTLPTIYSV